MKLVRGPRVRVLRRYGPFVLSTEAATGRYAVSTEEGREVRWFEPDERRAAEVELAGRLARYNRRLQRAHGPRILERRRERLGNAVEN